MTQLYNKPTWWTPVVLWVWAGDSGKFMCPDCKSDECYGCPAAWRQVGDRTEYYREPKHGYKTA